MESSSKESRLLLAIQAIEKDPKLSIRKATHIYNAPRGTLQHHIHNQHARRNILPNFRKLTPFKKDILLKRIFNLDNRRFSPNYTNIEDIANYLLAERNKRRIK